MPSRRQWVIFDLSPNSSRSTNDSSTFSTNKCKSFRDEETGERRLDTSGQSTPIPHPMDLSDMIPSLSEAAVPANVLKTWSSLPDAVRKTLVESELGRAGLSSTGIATSSLTKSQYTVYDDRNGADSHTESDVDHRDIGLSLSNSFGSTIRTEDSTFNASSNAIADFCKDLEDARKGHTRTDSFVTVSKVPSPPHLLGLRPPTESIETEGSSIHASPMMRVLNQMPDYPINGEYIKEKLQYSSLLDLLPDDTGSAILPTESDKREPLTHSRLRKFIESFDYLAKNYSIAPGDRVGIAMPNGPELGICLLTVCSRACAVPLNPNGTADEIRRDLEAVHAKVVISLEGTTHIEGAARQMGIPIIHLTPSKSTCGLFTIASPSAKFGAHQTATARDQMTAPLDHALVLFTSGTSGKKKVVPYTLSNMVVGAACIIKSWGLRPDDVNLNMMPLSHM